ncbi:SGNH/GDSL hydrolase family protein [Pectobacterium versatile]|uniref:SGNH/GDSL hydrolase family protein n=1 Tax=Pectobacterium versatile TaxID=2488639 RepID=UPI001CF20D51|nr:SGNH/GDSL hydrolase family protein [Pectobacterium versatile]MCA6927786.1 SGNH/GDSL hydrolase family protein [Pectobacterium versatile]MCH5084532.1 SGNH/GDSL hydrolase family protein [Pectobacterium versatile]
MANLPESSQWADGVYQIERNDPVGGGPDGTANKPIKDLTNRTRWLFEKFNTAFDDLGWIQLGLWEIGVEVSLPTQIVNYQGSWYRYAGNLDAPHVISGASPDEDGNWINVGDAALRSELLLPPSAIRAAAVTHTTPEMFNAVGNGVDDDSVAINTAVNVGESVFLKDERKYFCPDYYNRYGTPIIGGGSIVEAVSGGMKKRNTYVDANQRITGLENLATWYRSLFDQLNNPTRPLTILFSGDSTTAGDGTISGYRIDELVKAGMFHEGTSPAFGINAVNAGHSGAMTAHWADTYVDADIAANPDLYVLRWGINDPGYLRADGSAAPINAGQQYPGRRTMHDFIDSLRKGLAKIRETHSFQDASILLMTPSSTWDIPNARDPIWYEQLKNAILQVARDYQCAFIDTYAIMQDVSSLANILMDDPFGDGRGIHPNSAMNPVIAGYIVDAISPRGIARKLARNAVVSVGGAERPALMTDTGSTFNHGIHMSRALSGNGWPVDGSVLTIRYPDEVMLQINSAYQLGSSGYTYIRSGRAASLNGEAEGWNPMHILCTSPDPINVTPSEGYAIGLTPGTELKISRSGATVTFSTGFVEKTEQNGSGIPAFTTVCKVPNGYAPVRESALGTAIVWDGVNGFESIPCRIRVSGDVELLKPTPFVTHRIYFNISYDLR